MKKSIVLLTIVALLASAFVGPAAAQKKKKKKPKTPPPCVAISPANAGQDAESVVLTDAHTAEAPLVQTVTLPQNFSEGLLPTTPSSVNVTVDTALPQAGLYATLSFPTRRDYDLYAYWPETDNAEAASSHGFNLLIETQGTPADVSNTGTNHAGETKADSENLVGVTTPDCGGYTISAYNYFGEGGDLELTLWLGEPKEAPLPE